MPISSKRSKSGAAIAEAAAAMVIMIPLMIMLLFATIELSYACFLINNLSQVARLAARNLAIAYGANPNIAGNRGLENSLVFDHIRLANLINDSSQFDEPVYQTATQPQTVTVTVRYLSGQFSLPVFPIPDPLNIGQNFQPVAQSTYRLE